MLTAGNLGLILQRRDGGVRLASLYDIASRRQLLAAESPAAFRSDAPAGDNQGDAPSER